MKTAYISEDKVTLDLQVAPKEMLTRAGIPTNMGVPTPQQHRMITDLIGRDSQPEEWFVFPMLASHNLISRSLRRWHLSILKQMADYFKGKETILDHNSYEVEDTVGFVFDTMLINQSSCHESLINQPGRTELNKAIVNEMGFTGLILYSCVKSSLTPVVEGILDRRLHNCSTGGLLSEIRPICPICTKEKGREVSFIERDQSGNYVCPHEPPGWWSDDDDFVAPYVIMDGVFDPLEISLVQAPNIPGAAVIR